MMTNEELLIVEDLHHKLAELRRACTINRALLKRTLLVHGVNVKRDMGREIGNIAKDLDIPFEELKKFVHVLLIEIINEELKQ